MRARPANHQGIAVPPNRLERCHGTCVTGEDHWAGRAEGDMGKSLRNFHNLINWLSEAGNRPTPDAVYPLWSGDCARHNLRAFPAC
jgi:hypothetical protein